ncbi:hypothetical protein [Nostoc sp. NMS8]|uniref:hypothetical protein n=1 Tax=Nostoc sp. NMS8 TaxID=2815392 RepID=UPI0025CFD742|nr:hypothetical protein [Nostoc sp. NMS8]MBN3960007.1 hypothetical protein [Nostoc sp. NMS8]
MLNFEKFQLQQIVKISPTPALLNQSMNHAIALSLWSHSAYSASEPYLSRVSASQTLLTGGLA